MRVSRPALLLLAAAAVTGALGADRAGHVHRGASGEDAAFHRHAHLGPHRHEVSHPHPHPHPHSRGHSRHSHPPETAATRPASPAPREPAPPTAPDPEVPRDDGGYYRLPNGPPIPATAPSIEPTSIALAELPALLAPRVERPSRHDPFRPRPPPA